MNKIHGFLNQEAACSLEVMVRGEGQQPRLAIVFRSTGKRIPEHERRAWHSKVDVYFQQNTWVDTKTCMECAGKTLSKFVELENLSKFLLLCGNLDAQTTDQFKEEIPRLNGLIWYGLKHGTDLWQVVDAGIAQLLKSLIVAEHREWLDVENNANH